MNARDRVIRALSLRKPDRLPLDLGGINNTTMHVRVEKRLAEAIGLPPKESVIRSTEQQVVIPREDLLEYFDVDTRSLYLHESKPWREGEDGIFYDEWGIGRKKDPGGLYYSQAYHPLAEAESPADILAHTWPEAEIQARVRGLAARADSYNGRFCTVLEGFREVLFGLASWLRGTEQFYIDLALNPGMAEFLLDTVLDIQIEIVNYVTAVLGDRIDVIKVADDLGAQNSLLISPAMYRQYIKPRQRMLYQHIKSRGSYFLLLHSCGSISSILPDLIEIGVNAINPVQISAAMMEPDYLKRTFGKSICFWGGGIDTQETLPHCTPDEIKQEIKRNIRTFASGGGYVFAPVHNIQPDVPTANILAMFDAVREMRSL